jgi:pullulanase
MNKLHIQPWLKRFLLLILAVLVVPSQPTPSSQPVRPKLAAPFTEETIVFHYHRKDSNYTGWDLWIWEDNGAGKEYEFTNTDDYGVYMALPLSTWSNQSSINIIIRPGSWAEQTEDMKVTYANFPLGVDNARRVYLVDLDSILYPSADEAIGDKITSAAFTSLTSIEVTTNNRPNQFALSEDGEIVAQSNSLSATNITGGFKFTINLSNTFMPRFDYVYIITVTFESSTIRERAVNLNRLFDTTYFENNYVYQGADLGVTLLDNQTGFKLWAPTSYNVKLRIYDNGTPTSINPTLGSDLYTEYSMTLGEKGVWSSTINQVLEGKYYTYIVTNSVFNEMEVVDPYARSAGISGQRGMIVDFSKTNPEGWEQVKVPTYKETELVVYETHVADVTSATTWNGTEANRKKFLGLIESGTTYSQGGITVKTGFDHIKELGINALQIIPFYDQANDETNMTFNWGYNPQNFNVLEGGYSSNPYDGYNRIREFKEVVQAYAAADIGIIMDVVYNHVYSLASSNFNKIVPQYFFRYKANGSPSNGSGVGNDTASERLMYSYFIEQSVKFWAEEYKLLGFRFDLMGLHDIPTMNRVRTTLETVNPNIIIFGEPWEMSGTVPTKNGVVFSNWRNQSQMPGVGGFNDQMRDAIKGSVFSGTSQGWIQKPTPSETDVNRIVAGIKGTIAGSTDDPKQVVNYVSAHDNHTLFDKLQMSLPGYEELWPQIDVQANAIVLTSQGLAFLHAGEEFMRSKPLPGGKFDGNSYQSSYEVNALHWDRKVQYYNEFKTYQSLIQLKTKNRAFQFESREAINENVTVTVGNTLTDLSSTTLIVSIKNDQENYLIIHHGASARIRLSRIEQDLTGYQVLLDSRKLLQVGDAVTDSTFVQNYNTLILKKGQNPDGQTPNPITNTSLMLIVGGLTLLVVIASSAIWFFNKRNKIA